MTYQDQLIGLSDNTAQTVADLHVLFETGKLTRDEFITLAAQLIGLANAQAAAAADTSFRGYLEVSLGEAVALHTTTPDDPTPRLTEALTTLLDTSTDLADAATRLWRLGANEPLSAATNAYTEAMTRSPLVKGWRRGLDPDPCELCRWWWRDGRVWQPDHPMPRHPGCACVQIPVVIDSQKETNIQTTEQSAQRKQERLRAHV